MNILIIKLSAIGDVVHVLPSLEELRLLYPNAHITWLIEEDSQSLIRGHPLLDKVLVSRRKQWMKNLLKFARIRETLIELTVFMKDLRSRRYDLVIDFQRLFKSGIMVLFSGGKRKLGYKSFQEMSFLFYNETIFEDMGKHAVDRYLDFLRYLGAETGKPKFNIPISYKDKKHIRDLFQTYHIQHDDLVISVSPIALWETKLWAEENFAHLCDRIIEEFNARVIFTGNRKKEMITGIIAKMKYGAIDLSGKTNLRELACLYQNSDLVISTDSGPMHIAAAVQIPVVAIFGPTSYLRTGPYGEGHGIVNKNLPCSPCFKRKCKTGKCMKEITVHEVFEAVRSKLLKCLKQPGKFVKIRQNLLAGI